MNQFTWCDQALISGTFDKLTSIPRQQSCMSLNAFFSSIHNTLYFTVFIYLIQGMIWIILIVWTSTRVSICENLCVCFACCFTSTKMFCSFAPFYVFCFHFFMFSMGSTCNVSFTLCCLQHFSSKLQLFCLKQKFSKLKIVLGAKIQIGYSAAELRLRMLLLSFVNKHFEEWDWGVGLLGVFLFWFCGRNAQSCSSPFL